MLLSVLWPASDPTARVPTWVGCRCMSRGSWSVNLGSQRISREVVSWEAMVKGEGVVEGGTAELLVVVLTGGFEGRAWWLLLIGWWW